MEHHVFSDATPQELAQGYRRTGREYTCLICGKVYTQGVIYEDDGRLLEALLAMESHITREHGSTFQFLLNLDRKLTGLSQSQQQLLGYFQQGMADNEIAVTQGVSASTVRNHRFKLREKERQARVFLALMSLLGVKDDFVPIHQGATAVDERYAVTQAEEKKILGNYVRDGRLAVFPAKQKRKLIVLRFIAAGFQKGRVYTEREVNEVIQEFYDDFATIRRYLIEYGFMERSRDGSQYRVNTGGK